MFTRTVRIALSLCLALVASAASSFAQGVMPVPVQQFLASNGDPLSSGKLCTYAAGTTTPQATYSDFALSVPRSNPVILDSAGRPTGGAVYLSATGYKFLLLTAGSDSTCATGTTEWTQDNVYATAPANLAIIAGKVTYTAATVLTVSSNAVLPTQNVHAIDTSGGAQNLNTITTTNTAPGFILYLTANNAANPVTVKTGAGNIVMNGGDYLLNSASTWVTLMLKGTTWYEIARAGGSVLADNAINRFRATLTSGTCVTNTDVTAATTIYWTPCDGNIVSLFDGASTWNLRSSAEISIALPAAASQMYDLFVYDNAGTPTLELTAWTNDTTRATALTTQNGVLVKSGATTRRYLGSVRTTTVAGQTEDSMTKRYLWNFYHRERRQLLRQDTASSWSYSTSNYRQANANTANQVDVVVGVAGAALSLSLSAATSNTNATQTMYVAIGEDTLTVPGLQPGQLGGYVVNPVASGTSYSPIWTALSKTPAIGRHVYAWLEYGGLAGTTSWIGQTVNNTPSGLSGWIEG